MKQRYAVVDLETTGHSPKKGDSIIQFACVVIEEDTIIDQYSTYIRPSGPIPPFIEELTGISDEMVKDAPPFSEVAEKINSLLAGAVFVAHNVLFDLSFLQEELTAAGFEGFYGSTIDTVELAKILLPSSDSFKLSSLSREEGLSHERPHQADSDAYVTAMLFLRLKEKMGRLPAVTLKQLFRLSFSLKSEISDMIGLFMEEKAKKALEPLDGLEIFRGIAIKVPSEQKKRTQEQDGDYDYSFESRFSRIQKAIPLAEKRLGQLQMMDRVYEALRGNKCLIAEAGTGIGKSLGYLYPASYYTHSSKKKVIISTYTRHLQDQLLEKEIPALNRILPFGIRVNTLKGRNNYLSLARFERVLRQKDDNYDTSLTKMQILVWLTQTNTGDKEELHLSSGGEGFWDKLQTTGDLPAKLQEPWQERDFFERAREAAAQADMIITNHSYLIQDQRQKQPILPRNAALILDEAHHLPGAYSKTAGIQISYLAIRTLINRLGLYSQKMILYRLEKTIREKEWSVRTSLGEAERHIHDFLYETDQLFHFLSRPSKGAQGQKNTIIRYDANGESREQKAVRMSAERAVDFLQRSISAAEERLQLLEEREEFLGKSHLYYVSEARNVLNEMKELKNNLREFFLMNNPYSVYWTEASRSGHNVSIMLCSQPVTPRVTLWDSYLSKFSSVIFTSATLEIKGTFSFFSEQLGIPVDVDTAVYPSPFNYKEKVKVIIPSSMPDISKTPIDLYAEEVARHIRVAAEGSRGRMLVLFTSKELLKLTHEQLKKEEALAEYTLLAQGITGGSKWKLLKSFQGFEKGILLGNSSFWDGVDIPGDALSCLVIVRLPFASPDDVVNAAMGKYLTDQGRKPFSDFSLPQAILRFKQGFGRLIRSESDKGVLIIMDRRILTASYGRAFLEAVPPVYLEEASIGELGQSVRKWLD
ncbi:ATP-dependent DNA helicase DinG [Peribacillus kribbensis]|uniref:ATP-dependent DNA helicase DinG n=1 Tax=Peribacillus kribbensis TaxID=356658 RepID=UPI000412ABE1|nr:ATP-dependent DNA helicase DinG [Peribacillus kribbensis]